MFTVWISAKCNANSMAYSNSSIHITDAQNHISHVWRSHAAFSKLFTLQITSTITDGCGNVLHCNEQNRNKGEKKTCNGLHACISMNFRVPIATKLVNTNERIISAHVIHCAHIWFPRIALLLSLLFLFDVNLNVRTANERYRNGHINYAHYYVENVYMTQD